MKTRKSHLYYVPEFDQLIVMKNYYGKVGRYYRDIFRDRLKGKTTIVWVAHEDFGYSD